MAITKDIVPVLQKEISPLVAKAEALDIKTPQDMEAASIMLTQLNKSGDNIEAEREKVTVPLNAALKAERGRWKPLETAIESAVSIIRTKMSKFQTEQKRIADEAARKIAARTKEGRGNLKPETAVAKIKEIDTPAELIEVQGGSVKFRTDSKLRVHDTPTVIKWLVANGYVEKCSFNAGEIIKLLRSGVKIDGCEMEEIQVPINHR